MAKELILEIGTEEIPAGFIEWAIRDLSEIAAKKLEGASLKFESISAYGTPRRLTLRVTGLAEKQEDVTQEIYGPPVKIAFDENGNYTKPAEGFAKSQGVDVKELITVSRDRGDFLAVVKKSRGLKTDRLLKELLPDIMLSIQFRKSMKWGSGEITFARPVRWILALYGGKTVSFELEGLKSGNKSRGHRFMRPKPFKVTGWGDYTEGLDTGYVMLDQDRRKSEIDRGVKELASKLGGGIEEDADLLETVTNLVEYPVVLKGNFEKEFLDLPKEVLISVMKSHQKYFHVVSRNDTSKLLPYFIFVCGTPVNDTEVVSRGNERVIRARFSDARFFYDEDRRGSLEDKVENLKGMVFLSDAGSYYDKTERIKLIAGELADSVGYAGKKTVILRAASLCKADLATQMVFEFPELQGIMGRYYALSSGESEETARAIEEHYMPVSRDGALPGSEEGAVVSIADKLDSISACFICGLIPTGTSDPYALRRHAIGIINIILDKELTLPLGHIIRCSLKSVIDQNNGFTDAGLETAVQILDFMRERFRNIMIEKGFSYDVVDAVIGAGFDDILDCRRKIEALSEFSKAPDFEPLGIAFKRVVNIVKGQDRTAVDETLFRESVERELYDSFADTSRSVESEITGKNYPESLSIMKNLKEPVDRFFDNVMVMDKDPDIRQNRIALLHEIRELFFKIADFSKLSG